MLYPAVNIVPYIIPTTVRKLKQEREPNVINNFQLPIVKLHSKNDWLKIVI